MPRAARRDGCPNPVSPHLASSNWHIISCEYPPQVGGVADFTRVIARGLAARGESVDVWAPAPAASEGTFAVHEVGSYRATALPALDRAVDACPGPRRLFVQWVPHGYGYKSLNVPFCAWIASRARRGDIVDLMVHEPFLPFERRRLRQNAGAAVHRGMLLLLLRAASRVWVSTPTFIPMIRRFGPASRQPAYRWLPIPSPLPSSSNRHLLAAVPAGPVIGHFSTFNPLVLSTLEAVFVRIAEQRPGVRLVLLGRGGEAFVEGLRSRRPDLTGAVLISGTRSAEEISAWMRRCDLFVQLYPDGVSARRTTLMALLEHGVPVVATRGPAIEDFWGRALCLTSPDARSIATAAIGLLDSSAARADLALAGRHLYAERFHSDHAISALLDNALLGVA